MPIRVSGGVLTDLNQVQIGTAGNFFKWVAPDTLKLFINSGTAQTWTVAPPSGDNAGIPIGFSEMLHLTY